MKFILLCFLLTHLLFSNEIILTNQEKLWIKNNPVIYVGGEMDWAPFDFVNKDGIYNGISNDYLKLIEKKSGLKFQVVTGFTWAELIAKFKAKKFDLLPAVNYSEERENYGLYTSEYYFTKEFLFVKKNSSIKNMEDLSGKKLAIPKGYTIILKIKTMFPQINIIEKETVLDCVHAVLNGEVDAAFEVQAVMAHALKTSAISGLKGVNPKEWSSQPLFMLVQKEKALLADIINASLESISDKEHKEIANRWLTIKYGKTLDITLLSQISLAFLIILLFFFYRQHTLQKHNKLLSIARREAEEANQSKSDFLANMSHEIRTPMTAILGFIERLKSTEQDTERLKQIQVVEESGRTLLLIINDILDFSKIESGKLEIELSPYNINELFDNSMSIFSSLASSKNISLHRVTHENLPQCIIGDAMRLKQIVFNLLTNAIKFTDEGGNITLQARYNTPKKTIYIAVIDTGVGIAKENLEKIFEAFSQEDVSTTRKFGGTGLGLSISSRLVHLMGAELKVESEVDQGSKFYFEIPVEICHQSTLEEKINPPQEPNEVSTLKGHILIVEDNKTNQMLLSMILDDYDITYDIANDGAEGVLSFKHNKYDGVLMDENMPIMNGIEAAKHIRELEKENALQPTPIIAVTANALIGDREKFLAVGMDDYIPKPYSEEDIIEVLQKYLD